MSHVAVSKWIAQLENTETLIRAISTHSVNVASVVKELLPESCLYHHTHTGTVHVLHRPSPRYMNALIIHSFLLLHHSASQDFRALWSCCCCFLLSALLGLSCTSSFTLAQRVAHTWAQIIAIVINWHLTVLSMVVSFVWRRRFVALRCTSASFSFFFIFFFLLLSPTNPHSTQQQHRTHLSNRRQHLAAFLLEKKFVNFYFSFFFPTVLSM